MDKVYLLYEMGYYAAELQGIASTEEKAKEWLEAAHTSVEQYPWRDGEPSYFRNFKSIFYQEYPLDEVRERGYGE